MNPLRQLKARRPPRQIDQLSAPLYSIRSFERLACNGVGVANSFFHVVREELLSLLRRHNHNELTAFHFGILLNCR